MRLGIALSLVVLGLMSASRLEAGSLSVVDTPAGIGATDSIDWGQFGSEFTNFSNPSTGTTAGGDSFTVSQLISQFGRRDEGTSWGGNFNHGDHLLWTANESRKGAGPVTINFGANFVGAAGMNIMAAFYGAFTARITAYNSSNGLLGSFTEDGLSNSAEGTAIFIGVKDSTNDIAKIVVGLDSASSSPSDFAINTILTGPAPAPPPPPTAPEIDPGSAAGAIALAGMGLTLLRVRRRRVG